MIRHYLITAFRFLRRNKLYTAINIFGLSVSLAIAFIILLFVINELSFNHCHSERDRVFRVVNHYIAQEQSMAGTPYALAEALQEAYPQVVAATNTRFVGGLSRKQGEEFIPVRFAFATDAGIFEIFTMPFTQQPSKSDPLSDRYDIILSESLARSSFPGENAVGKELVLMLAGAEHVFTVSAVYRDLPRNSSFQPGCLLHGDWEVDALNRSFGMEGIDQSWMHDFWETWVLLEDRDQSAFLNAELEAFLDSRVGEERHNYYYLQQLGDVYLRSADIANTWNTGNLKDIRLFSGIALFIVLIAAINYIMLSVAVSTGRAREIGMRKVAGAGSRIIQKQVYGETIAFTFLVLPLSLLLMELFMPLAERLFATTLKVIPANLPLYLLAYILIVIIIGLLSGAYASAYLSRLRVIEVLQQRMQRGQNRRIFRSFLSVTQLVVFSGFLSATLLIRLQYRFAMEMDPGYQRHHILQVDLGGRQDILAPLLDRISNIPEVEGAGGAMTGLPMQGWMTFMKQHFTDPEKQIKMEGYSVDYGLTEAIGLKVLEGRSFSREYGSDLEHAILLNETAVKQLGIEDPVGMPFDSTLTIIGVVKDFNLHSIHSEIPPLVIQLTDRYIRCILVRYKPGSLEKVKQSLEEAWHELEPERPFESQTIEELFADVYGKEKRLISILSLAALIAMLISALGLFAMTLFTSRQRTREIGIRKVYGSPGTRIVWSLLRENLINVALAGMISTPLTWLLISKWLESYPFRTDIRISSFLFSLILTAIVVLLTAFFHAYRASRRNPVESLRYE